MLINRYLILDIKRLLMIPEFAIQILRFKIEEVIDQLEKAVEKVKEFLP